MSCVHVTCDTDTLTDGQTDVTIANAMLHYVAQPINERIKLKKMMSKKDSKTVCELSPVREMPVLST